MRKALVVFLASGALAMAGIISLNLAGTWLLDWQGLLPDEKLPCVYQGPVSVMNALQGGSASVSLKSGPDACPDEMTAHITSIVVDGSSISGVLDGGQAFGALDFQGSLVAPQQSALPRGDQAPLPQGLTLAGSFTVRPGGPFGGSEGSWQAELTGPLSQIPMLNPAGLLAFAMMLAAAALFLRQRKGTFSH